MKELDKKIKRKVGALAVLGVLLAILCVPIAFASDPDTTVTSNGNYVVDIDNNNDESDRAFIVSHDGGTELFRVREDGKVGIGAPIPVAGLDVMVAVTSTPGAAWGGNFGSTLTAAHNNDELIGVRIAPIFVDSTYTGIKHYGLIVEDGDVGIGNVNPTASLHVDQASTTGNKPVLTVDQADASEEFIRFIGTSANGVLTQSIVENADVTTATLQGWLKVYVQDDGNQLTDQAYFVPIYTLA